MNATREQITGLIGQGRSTEAIARELGCDKGRVRGIRQDLGVPNAVRQLLTLEEKWRARTRPVDGGHLEWVGEHVGKGGTPVMRYREKSFTAAAIAFRIRHGRAPQGYAIADCGHQHCVAPEHVLDGPGRTRTREQLRYLSGGRQRPARCRRGHDQGVHGTLSADGRSSYCKACKADRRAGAVA